MIRRPPRSTLFPYTTLFRSRKAKGDAPPAFFERMKFLTVYGYSTSEVGRSEEHTSELQSHSDLVCRLLLEKKKKRNKVFLKKEIINTCAKRLLLSLDPIM